MHVRQYDHAHIHARQHDVCTHACSVCCPPHLRQCILLHVLSSVVFTSAVRLSNGWCSQLICCVNREQEAIELTGCQSYPGMRVEQQMMNNSYSRETYTHACMRTINDLLYVLLIRILKNFDHLHNFNLNASLERPFRELLNAYFNGLFIGG